MIENVNCCSIAQDLKTSRAKQSLLCVNSVKKECRAVPTFCLFEYIIL